MDVRLSPDECLTYLGEGSLGEDAGDSVSQRLRCDGSGESGGDDDDDDDARFE